MPSSSRQKRRPSRKNKRKRSNDTAAFEFSTKVEEDYGVSKKRRLDCKAVALGIFVLTLMIVGASAEFISMLLRAAQKSEEFSWRAINRKPKSRPTWASEMSRISDELFYRLFRMHRPCFNLLCNKIEKAVGKKKFKSEKYINDLKAKGHSTKESSMLLAAIETSGDYIPGEVKVAMTLRILAGASYLDMFLWYNVDPDHVRNLTRAVMKDWFCNDDVMMIDFYRQVLQDSGAIERIRTEFAEKTNGIFWGCIGALDGWLVKIHCPSLRELRNPGKYFSRKGFHAINVQVIVDKKKRILWRYIGEKGSSHDSKVFNESGLGKYLLEYADSLHARGLYIIGDSAYSIRSYLLTPFDNAQPQSIEDNFNYFLSSNRIYVECAFGEIDRRWGIFWKPLEGALVHHQYTIDSALRLHNFIVNYREEMGEGGGDHQRSEREEFDLLSDEYAANNPFASLGPIAEEMDELRKKVVRDHIRNDLSNRGLARPSNARVSTTDRHNRELETYPTL
jgi:hypothetical protein